MQKCNKPSIGDYWYAALDIYKVFINQTIKRAKNSFSVAITARYDPLILDIDGDGFNIETKENGANFDLDKNGLAEKINWTKKDGILCLDLNITKHRNSLVHIAQTQMPIFYKMRRFFYVFH